MSENHFSTLGLRPGRYPPQAVQRQFERRRAALLRQLSDPTLHAAARVRLDDLHVAHQALCDPRRQAEHLEALGVRLDAAERLRRLIRDSLEGDLLRCSRRERILAEGRRLGFSDFHIHLLIAETQFGWRRVLAEPEKDAPPDDRTQRGAARLAAAGVLALAMFLFMIRWLGV